MASAVDSSYAARLALVTLLVICATFQDLRHQKITNRLLGVFFVVGLIIWGFGNGLMAFRVSLLSALLVLITLFPLFMLRALSGGDVKLFAVIAGLTGIELFIPIFMLSLVAGGFAGVLVWFRRAEVSRRAKREAGQAGWNRSGARAGVRSLRGHRFPFAYPIMVGTLFGILGKGNLSALFERF